jgi:hypothetical protein
MSSKPACHSGKPGGLYQLGRWGTESSEIRVDLVHHHHHHTLKMRTDKMISDQLGKLKTQRPNPDSGRKS